MEPLRSSTAIEFREVERAASSLGMSISSLDIKRVDDLDHILRDLVRNRPDALFVLADPLTSVYRARILEAAGTYRLPVAATYQLWGTDGALMTSARTVQSVMLRPLGGRR